MSVADLSNDAAVIAANIKRLGGEYFSLCERFIPHLRELALLLCSGEPSFPPDDDFRKRYGTAISEIITAVPDVIVQNRHAADECKTAADEFARIYLCGVINELRLAAAGADYREPFADSAQNIIGSPQTIAGIAEFDKNHFKPAANLLKFDVNQSQASVSLPKSTVISETDGAKSPQTTDNIGIIESGTGFDPDAFLREVLSPQDGAAALSADSTSSEKGLQEGVYTGSRISYLQSPYADAAYVKFSLALAEPTVTYCHDFTGVCEDVYYGRAVYCILPIENTVDGRLASFRLLIRKYELKIVLTCSVETSDGTSTRFALLKKSAERLRCPETIAGPLYFEFEVPLPDPSALGGILKAARYFGHTLNRLDSTPSSYAESEYSYDAAFLVSQDGLDGFLTYLLLEVPRFTAVGVYTHLKI